MTKKKTIVADMHGAYAALFTPYDSKGRVNAEMIEKIIDRGYAAGLRGFYLTGTTGEWWLLSTEERKAVYDAAVKANRGRGILIAHVGANRTEDAVELARHAAKIGIDWVSSVTPQLYRTSFDATLYHYRMVSEATDLPFLVYSIGSSLTPERDARLFDLKNVKGMKYTGSDYFSAQLLKRRVDAIKETVWFAGRDEQLLCALALGKDMFVGGIGTTYNIIPRHFANICQLAWKNDFESAAKWQSEANRVVALMVESDNWTYRKAMMRHLGLDCGSFRSPFEPLTRVEYAKYSRRFAALLKEIGPIQDEGKAASAEPRREPPSHKWKKGFVVALAVGLASFGVFAENDQVGKGKANEPNVITVDAANVRFPVAEDMWGIFFEDVSLSLDGGIYAELVRNRSFEDGGVYDQRDFPWSWQRRSTSLEYWNPVGVATMTPDFSKPLSRQNTQCIRVDARPGGGIANDGYFGIAVKEGARYRLSVVVRGDMKGPLAVSLETFGKPAFARGEIADIGVNWRTNTLELTATASDPTAKLVFRAPQGGTFYMDCVSLFPCDTYGKSGLFRKDLMERLMALKPSFVRFPGGCWVEGATMAEAYRWKKTIGSVWNRRTQWNTWNYWSTNGVGFHEYLVLCEELGAKALFCINCGMSHGENVPMDKMDEFVQDALDAIEYANGPVTSKWGAERAKNGHPEPFNLQYLEIGNENGGKPYHERYALIHDAVQAKYPEVMIISDYWQGPLLGRPQHIRDEHYYNSPDWFMTEGAEMYDKRPRGDYKVFVGEYAATAGVGRWGNIRGAIGEAAFMTALERNADLVKLAAYAPLFANANHTAWTPNLIYHMTEGSFVNPSWNVQKLFGENRGKEVLSFVQTGKWMTAKNGKCCRVIACSAVRDEDGSVIVKLVNCSEEPQSCTLKMTGGAFDAAEKTVFSRTSVRTRNSPMDREAVGEEKTAMTVTGGAVFETLPPLSLTVCRFRQRD